MWPPGRPCASCFLLTGAAFADAPLIDGADGLSWNELRARLRAIHTNQVVRLLEEEKEMGIDPAVIAAALKELGRFLRSEMSDPVKDRERMGRLDLAYDLAMAGNTQPQPEFANISAREYVDRIAADAVEEDGGTAAGSKVARAYAMLVKAKLAVAGR